MYDILYSYLKERYFQVKYEDEITGLHLIKAGVPQGSVLGPILYLLFTSDLPTDNKVYTATFADDTAILAVYSDPVFAADQLQENLNKIQTWTKKWKIKLNESKSSHIVFTKCHSDCPQISLNNAPVSTVDTVKYLGLHMGKGLTWKTHIWKKRKHLIPYIENTIGCSEENPSCR